MKKNLLYLFFGLILLSSCETEIDTLAEYKDITVVYGLLNQNETDHYIRITKAISAEGNALDLANNGSNFNYADGELKVTIDEYDASGVFKKSFSLTRVDASNVIPKDDGIFDSSVNILYMFSEPNLKQDYLYKLKIVNTKLGKEITSETVLAFDPSLSYLQEMDRIKLFNIGGTSLTHTFSIKPKENSGRIKVYFVFNYVEHYTDLTNKHKSIKISLGEQKTSSTADGGDILLFTLEGASLLSALQTNIPVTTPNLKSRSIGNGSLEVIVAGPDLSTYIAVNEPSISVNQNKPEFTNLVNGLGVFSSRNTTTINSYVFTTEINGATVNPENLFGFNKDGQINYDNETLKKLLTLGLDFCNPRNEPLPLPVPAPTPRCEQVLDSVYWSGINPN